jgi:hypothetical protein
MAYREVFERVEKKYLIREEQCAALMERIGSSLEPDAWGASTVCNLYYDTPSFYLIRTSIEKPLYKEKLRLRCYGVPNGDTASFLEIKKKYKGIVYKRRMALPYEQGLAYLGGGERTVPKGKEQIAGELNWFLQYYPQLAPRTAIFYDRQAFFVRDNDALRLTFDRNIRWRMTDLDLRCGSEGTQLLEEGYCLMEIKIPGALPLWLVEALEKTACYPAGFSKYGRAYQANLLRRRAENTACNENEFERERICYA